MNESASILVGANSDQAFVQVRSKGSFQNAPGLKQFYQTMVDRGYRHFIIDLGECTGMDSTFMGTLAGIALRLKELGSGSLQVVSITERNLESLQNLGLDALFDISAEPDAAATHATSELPAATDRSVTAGVMVEAHQALIDANPQNFVRFKDVLEFLQDDIQNGIQ